MRLTIRYAIDLTIPVVQSSLKCCTILYFLVADCKAQLNSGVDINSVRQLRTIGLAEYRKKTHKRAKLSMTEPSD